jgi:hypothetical protein
VSADDTLKDIRHPEARQKTRNRSGQAAGISKMSIGGVFSWRLIEMQESPAYRVLSLSARKIMDRLEIELRRHGGKPEDRPLGPAIALDGEAVSQARALQSSAAGD